MLLLEPSTPTQYDSIPSNQNHFQSLDCQVHVSKSSPKINLTFLSGRAPVLVLLRFHFFLKPPMRSFQILVMENLQFLLLLEPSTPTQYDSIPSNENHFWSLGCQLHVSKSSPKINLTFLSGRTPVLVLLRFHFFLKPPMRSFQILVMENLPFLRNYNLF